MDGAPEHEPSVLRRPPRLKQVFTPRGRPLFFVTTCTRDRMRCLANDKTHDAFRLFSERSPELAGVWIGRYVIMPDHLHVFVSAEGSDSLARWVGSLKRHLTRILKPAETGRPVWQQGFFDHLLRHGESYSEKWDYVFRNPVRAGLVEIAEEWPFSGEIQAIEW